MSAADGGYYERLYQRQLAAGLSARKALSEVAEAYLDGRPESVGRHKWSGRDRDQLFWSSACVLGADRADWREEAMGLALARYLAQDKISACGLLGAVARQAPAVLIEAVRHSGLVLRPDSPHRRELQQAAVQDPELVELCCVLDIFEQAHALRRDELARRQAPFARMPLIELLAWASLYAFEHLVPHGLHEPAALEAQGTPVDRAWDAINELLLWKLRTGNVADLRLDEARIAEHVGPLFRDWLFSEDEPSEFMARSRMHFQALMAAQIEMLEFMSRSIDAFCWDDSICFERHGDRLEIVETDPAARADWQRDTRKLWQLQGYWLDRAVDAFAHSDVVTSALASPRTRTTIAWPGSGRGPLKCA